MMGVKCLEKLLEEDKLYQTVKDNYYGPQTEGRRMIG
jgi:hypothetical protein